MDPGADKGSMSLVSLLLCNGLCFLLSAGLPLHHRETVFVLIVPSCSATSTTKGSFQKRKFQVPAELKGDRIDGSLK